MHWSAFCLFHWWKRNFEDAHEYRLLSASCFRWNPCLTFCKFTKSLHLQFLFILQRLAFMTRHQLFPACPPFVNTVYYKFNLLFSAFSKLVIRLQFLIRWIHKFSCLFFASHNSVDWRENFKSHDMRIKGKSTWFFFFLHMMQTLLLQIYYLLLLKLWEITGVQQNTAFPTTYSEYFSFFNKSFHFFLWKLSHWLWY